MNAKLSLSLGLVASIGGYLADAARAATPAGPHLIVTSVKAASDERKPFHRFVNRGSFELVVKIKNDGTAPMSRKGDHQAVLMSKPIGFLRVVVEADFPIPRLSPGDTAIVHVPAQGHESGRPDSITTAVPKACVPVRGNAHFNERGALNDRQNCRTGPQFAVIPKSWSGTMSVIHPIFGYAKSETDSTVKFTYSDQASQGNDAFVYGGRGDLVHSVSGSNAFCSIAGGMNGRIGPGDAFLRIEPNLIAYRGQMTTGEVMKVTQTCNGVSSPTQIRTDGIRIGPADRADESDTKLQDSASLAGGLDFKWDLDADT